jgi:ADP-sugar diphosphatase
MSSFRLPQTHAFFPGVEITLPPNLTRDKLLTFKPFNNWLSTLHQSLAKQTHATHPFHESPYKLRFIEIQVADFFTQTHLGFLKLRATVTNDDDECLPGAVFMRGGSVAVLVIVSSSTKAGAGEDYAIMTLQPRIAAGSLSFLELPAGMLDDEGSFKGVAAREIKEETGLDIREDELIDMTRLAARATKADDDDEAGGAVEAHLQVAAYPSPGGCDEFMPLFVTRKTMGKRDMDALKGKLTGLRDEGEKITLRLVPLRDVWKVGVRDMKTLSAIALYEGLRREGKLK